VCTYFVDKVHERILKRQAHIAIQRQTHIAELFSSVAVKYIPPGSSAHNVWDAGLMVSSGHDSWPIVPASGDSEDDCGEADGM
jgi:hypothetical protein